MKMIMNVEITQGYAKWVNLFRSTDEVRAKYGITVLAYGHDKDDESRIYQVLEIESMEQMQEAMADPELQRIRTEAGVNLDTQQVVLLVE